MNDEWVLLAANCECCATPSSPVPLRLEITQAEFLAIGRYPWGYHSEGDVIITSRVIWSDGNITNVERLRSSAVFVDESGIYGGCGPYSFTVDGVVYSVPMTSFFDVKGDEWRYSAYVVAMPESEFIDAYTIGDGTAAVASVDFEAQE